jgi:hypothetical protein
MVYPEGRSSIRFERLIEGIQMYEKVQILRQEFEQKGDWKRLSELEKCLATFQLSNFPDQDPAKTLQEARKVIDQL